MRFEMMVTVKPAVIKGLVDVLPDLLAAAALMAWMLQS